MQRLLKLRYERGLTQQQLADRLHVDLSTIQRWEAGTSFPWPRHLRQLCAVFMVSQDDLVQPAEWPRHRRRRRPPARSASATQGQDVAQRANPLDQTAQQQLLNKLALTLPAEEMFIANHLVRNLDERGYLATDLERLTHESVIRIESARAVLRVLQAQEPAGIGARNLRECLVLQIARLEKEGISQPYAYEIITRFLSELGDHRFGDIARELRIPERTVADVWEFLKTKMHPYPARGLWPIDGELRRGAAPARADYLPEHLRALAQYFAFESDSRKQRWVFLCWRCGRGWWTPQDENNLAVGPRLLDHARSHPKS